MYGSPEGLAMIIGIVIFAYLFWITVVLAGYIFKGIALSRLAKNAGLPNPALAWVPIGCWGPFAAGPSSFSPGGAGGSIFSCRYWRS